MEPFLGQIQPFGFSFAPRGWAFCNGQLMAISQNSALFSLFGTTFGGDGRTSFGLPDLRGRDMISVGTGPGLSPIPWGQRSGNEWTYLTVSNLPAHSHTGNIVAEGGTPTSANPKDNMLGASSIFTQVGATPDKSMNLSSVNIYNTGNNTAFSNRPPFLGVYVSVALVGIYPSRS